MEPPGAIPRARLALASSPARDCFMQPMVNDPTGRDRSRGLPARVAVHVYDAMGCFSPRCRRPPPQQVRGGGAASPAVRMAAP